MDITNHHNIHAKEALSLSTHRCRTSGSEDFSNSAQSHRALSGKTRLLGQVTVMPEPMPLAPGPTKEERTQTSSGLNLKQLPKQATAASRKKGPSREKLVASGSLRQR